MGSVILIAIAIVIGGVMLFYKFGNPSYSIHQTVKSRTHDIGYVNVITIVEYNSKYIKRWTDTVLVGEVSNTLYVRKQEGEGLIKKYKNKIS